MMRLLVTGGAGFIGSNLIRRIIDKPEIESLVNLDCLTYAGKLSNLAGVENHPKYAFEKSDIRNKGEVLSVMMRHNITHVFHLAAESHVDRSIAGPDVFIQTNVAGTFNVLEACRLCWAEGFSGKRFHHVSTDEVYGSLGMYGSFTEETLLNPSYPYSASKAASEMVVMAYRKTYGLPTIITRCSNNYGPYQHDEKLIPMTISKVLGNHPILIHGDGRAIRDWIHVEDHVDALWLALTKGRDGEVYNIGGSNEWENIRIVRLICDMLDDCGLEEVQRTHELITHVEDRLGQDRRYSVNTRKFHREIGEIPRKHFRDGLRETVNWYLAQRKEACIATT